MDYGRECQLDDGTSRAAYITWRCIHGHGRSLFHFDPDCPGFEDQAQVNGATHWTEAILMDALLTTIASRSQKWS